MSRKKKLILNGFMALIQQLVNLVSGFILPRCILTAYGSEVNGLISSITQFLAFVSFLEMGLGPVIQSNLYRPLAEKNHTELSRIYLSGKRFFRKIAYIFLAYIVVLVRIFPYIAGNSFSHIYSGTLIIIISLSTFAQYYFGMMYQQLLNADQKAYIQFALNTTTIVLNTLFSVWMIHLGMGIHFVKLVSAALYLLRPMIMMVYIRKHYEIDRKIVVKGEPIQQKWNGFAQHMASVVAQNTDAIVLTIFSTLSDVSIYSVYYLVVMGVTDVVLKMVTGLGALWGNMLARDEKHLLEKSFTSVEGLVHTGVTFLFTVTAILIVPFVQVYTKEITDVDYVAPLFAITLVVSYGVRCLKIPYFQLIKSAGHYKQTQNGSIIQMIINITLSVLLVFRYGLVGVGAGTLFAMLYHTVYCVWYLRKNILCRRFGIFVRYVLKDCVLAIIVCILTRGVKLTEISYPAWSVMAIKVVLIAVIPTVLMNIRGLLVFINGKRTG